MRRTRDSQADPFGSITVSQLTYQLKHHIEERFRRMVVRGEVTNARQVGSGHLYFTLKDAECQLSCVMWRSAVARSPVRLRDGMEVIAYGEVQVYPPHGRYQLVARRVTEAGLGDLLARLELLKQALAAEGLFDADRKRPLPLVPRRIGLVTAPGSAALHDLLTTLRARFPADIVLCPVPVQGPQAARAIAWGIDKISAVPGVDVVIVGRGGGSLEDLWAFNEEIVVRAITACSVPIVSAVGHEVDTPLSDLAADVRAPTPTAAAELVVPHFADLVAHLDQRHARLARALARHSERQRARLSALQARLGDPRRTVAERQQALDGLALRLDGAIRARLQAGELRRAALAGRLRNLHPRTQTRAARVRVADLQRRLLQAARAGIAERRAHLAAARRTLTVLSPTASLDRGYAIVRDTDTRVVTRADEVAAGATLEILLTRGALDVTVDAQRSRHAFEPEDP